MLDFFLTSLGGYQQLFVTVVLLAFLFLILRDAVLWYFKVHKIVHLLEQIEKNTRKAGDTEMVVERTGPFIDEVVEKIRE